jgi:hypothetical protein
MKSLDPLVKRRRPEQRSPSARLIFEAKGRRMAVVGLKLIDQAN